MSHVSIEVPRKRLQVDEDDDNNRSQQHQGLTVVNPGEIIATEVGFLRGHGTYLTDLSTSPASASGSGSGGHWQQQQQQQVLKASVSGVVERVNKLVSVRATHSKYIPEIGDVVLARITEVAQGRWRADINSRSEAILLLSSVNLPGGVQRKRTYEDELNMRSYYNEGDLICAEVQAWHSETTPALHTRSIKYGKLLQGCFVSVPSCLIKRCKSHFVATDFGVNFIFGANGYVWVYPAVMEQLQQKVRSFEELDDQDQDQEQEEANRKKREEESKVPLVDSEVRRRVARLRNCFHVLAAYGVAIYPATVLEVYHASEAAGIPIAEMLKPHMAKTLAAKAREISVL